MGETTGHAVDTSQVPAHLWEYATGFDALLKASGSLETHLKHLLDESAIVPLTVSVRAKALESYQRKSERRSDNQLKYSDPHNQITDCIAARIITFSKGDKDRVWEVVRGQLCPHEDQNPGESKKNGYSSQHFLVGPGEWSSRLPHLASYYHRHAALEIQVRTAAEHAWAEYEHHVRFKPDGEGAYNSVSPEIRRRIDRLLLQSAGERENMDEKFGEIEEILRSVPSKSDDTSVAEVPVGSPNDSELSAPLNPDSLKQWLDRRYPASVQSGADAVQWMLSVLVALNIEFVEQLDEVLQDVDSESVAALIEYRYPPGRIRRLDDDLLAALGKGYIIANETVPSEEPNRERILGWRWGRLNGKLKIYTLSDRDSSSTTAEVELSASGAFREAVRMVARIRGRSAAVIEGAVSFRNDLPAVARAAEISTEAGMLWIHANLTRQLAEEYVVLLLDRLPDGNQVKFMRAGELLWPSAPPVGLPIGEDPWADRGDDPWSRT